MPIAARKTGAVIIVVSHTARVAGSPASAVFDTFDPCLSIKP